MDIDLDDLISCSNCGLVYDKSSISLNGYEDITSYPREYVHWFICSCGFKNQFREEFISYDLD